MTSSKTRRACVGAYLAQLLEERLVGHDEARVAHDALQDNPRYLTLIGG